METGLHVEDRPPVLPDRVEDVGEQALVYVTNVYLGPGLAGVPKGSVKNMRVLEYHYAYPEMGGHQTVAVEGGWDVIAEKLFDPAEVYKK